MFACLNRGWCCSQVPSIVYHVNRITRDSVRNPPEMGDDKIIIEWLSCWLQTCGWFELFVGHNSSFGDKFCLRNHSLLLRREH